MTKMRASSASVQVLYYSSALYCVSLELYLAPLQEGSGVENALSVWDAFCLRKRTMTPKRPSVDTSCQANENMCLDAN